MRNTSDSAVLNHVADFMVTITQDGLLKQNFMLCHRIIKNRFGRRDDIYFGRIWYEYMRVKDCTDEDIQNYTTSKASSEDTDSSFNKNSTKSDPPPVTAIAEKITVPVFG